MAEEQQQSKGIGELFVEFGAKGLPTLLKGLNSVSAQFLLTKNAAEQFTKPIINMGKDAANSAVGVAKLSSSLGTTLLEAQRLQLYLKKYNLSEGLLGDLGSTANMLTKVRMGIGGISGEFAYAMNRLELSWTNYDGSLESILRLTKDVQERIGKFSPAEQRVLLENLNFSPEWRYAFEKGLNLSDALAMSDKDIKDLETTSQYLNDASSAINKLKNTTIRKGAPILQQSANVLVDAVTGKATKSEKNNIKAGAIIGGTGGAATGALMMGAQGAIGGATVGSIIPVVGTTAGAIIGGIGGALTGAIGGGAAGTVIGAGGGVVYGGQKRLKGQPTGFAVPPAFQGTAHIPPNLNNPNTTIQVTNENHVSVATPQDVGPAISSISRDTLRDIEYSEFQTINRPGL